ncbi:hypothetical protein P4S64_06320 [Vibrio sp. M60_M31a]
MRLVLPLPMNVYQTQRAEHVAQYMIDTGGIDAERDLFHTSGAANQQPLTNGSNAQLERSVPDHVELTQIPTALRGESCARLLDYY